MKTKILSGLVCCLGIFSANAQTITAPVGQALSITNPIDIIVPGGTINVPNDGSFNVGGATFLKSKTGGNIFLGLNSGNNTLTGTSNLFLGSNAGLSNGTGVGNVFMGDNAGTANTTGSGNFFLGSDAGKFNTTGTRNVFTGISSGKGNILGTDNLFMGYNSAPGSNGTLNVYLGSSAGIAQTTGDYNTFVGGGSGSNMVTGRLNTLIGYDAQATTGVENGVAIGAQSRVTASNSIVLGRSGTNVGIGNTAPTSLLEITTGSSTTTGLKFTNVTSASATSSGGSNKVLSVDAMGNVILVGIVGATTTSVGGPIAENWKESDGYLYNNSTNGVVIKGTGLDGNSLIVKGGVLSKEVNVKVEGSESWPDYVFKPNYKRMTLGEVEKFIAINGHLPNIPSATEMVTNGNNLGKTDVKLLEKVEELTLYLLDMKKANDAQAAELKSLKQQVSKLRKK